MISSLACGRLLVPSFVRSSPVSSYKKRKKRTIALYCVVFVLTSILCCLLLVKDLDELDELDEELDEFNGERYNTYGGSDLCLLRFSNKM